MIVLDYIGKHQGFKLEASETYPGCKNIFEMFQVKYCRYRMGSLAIAKNSMFSKIKKNHHEWGGNPMHFPIQIQGEFNG